MYSVDWHQHWVCFECEAVNFDKTMSEVTTVRKIPQ